MRRRIFAVALAIALTLCCFAACGETAQSREEDKFLGSWTSETGMTLAFAKDESSGNYEFELGFQGYEETAGGIYSADGSSISLSYENGQSETVDYGFTDGELLLNGGQLSFAREGAGVSSDKLSGLQILTYSIVGFLTVFAVLLILFVVIAVQGKLMDSRKTAAPAEATAQADAPQAGKTDEVKLVNVDDETAAMIMAIVADESGIPPEELYFKSIKLSEGEENK